MAAIFTFLLGILFITTGASGSFAFQKRVDVCALYVCKDMKAGLVACLKEHNCYWLKVSIEKDACGIPCRLDFDLCVGFCHRRSWYRKFQCKWQCSIWEKEHNRLWSPRCFSQCFARGIAQDKDRWSVIRDAMKNKG